MWALMNTRTHLNSMNLQVCPPGLHITLGIFFRLFTLLENACHELDAKAVLQGLDGGRTYTNYIKAWERKVDVEDGILKLKTDLNVMEQLLTVFIIASTVSPNPTVNTRLPELQSDISTKKRELNDLVFYPLI